MASFQMTEAHKAQLKTLESSPQWSHSGPMVRCALQDNVTKQYYVSAVDATEEKALDQVLGLAGATEKPKTAAQQIAEYKAQVDELKAKLAAAETDTPTESWDDATDADIEELLIDNGVAFDSTTKRGKRIALLREAGVSPPA